MRGPLSLVVILLGASCASPAPVPGTVPPPGRPAAPPPFALLQPLAAPAPKSPVLVALEQEVARATAALREQPYRAYHLSYTAQDLVSTRIKARNGALIATYSDHGRRLATVLRVGDYAFDSGRWDPAERYFQTSDLPIEDDALAIRTVAWRDTQRAYRAALDKFRKLEEATRKRAEPRALPDFSREPPVVHLEPRVGLEVDVAAWEERLRRLSAEAQRQGVDATVTLAAEIETRWLVSSEGTVAQTSQPVVRLSVAGAELSVDFEARSISALPSEAEMKAAVARLAASEKALARAHRPEPWTGPVLFEARPAAVWLHEVLGHHLEGVRQHDDRAAQALAGKLGQPILPPFVSVFDDPLLAALGGQSLAGSYRIDHEGVPARRVTLVDGGVLRALLVGRSPAPGFTRSDGHGRWSFFRDPTGRQANLVLIPSVAASPDELRARLRDEARRQDLTYGLLVREADGVFQPPMNRRGVSYGVRLPLLWRVYVDGRPDEPVMAGMLAGDALASLAQVVAAGDDYHAANLGCFGDSGFLPLSATSPSLLFARLQVEPSTHYRDR